MSPPLGAVVACLLAASSAAAAPALEVNAGVGGRFRAGSWTPLEVAGAVPGEVLHVAVEDPDGEFVRSPPVRVPDGAAARFAVRFGRPAGRVRIENATTGTTAAIDLGPPLPSTSEVLLVLGDLPAMGRAARLMARPDAPRPVVITGGADGVAAATAAGSAGRDFDGVDLVVACGRSLPAVDPAALAGIDAWVRDGGRLLLVAGTSAEPLAAAGGPAAAWLPGPVEAVVPLRRVAAIETHARNPGLADRPGTAGLRVPLLANRATLAGTVDLFEGDAAGDLPLVVRRAHGFGSITWVGLDLDAEPFRGWPGTDTLLVRLLGGRADDDEPARSAAAAGPPDLAGQLRVALEAPGPGGGIVPVPFAIIAGLGILYVACIFPLDWWLVSRSGRPWLAWLTLPALVAGFTVAVWAAAGRGRAGAGDGMRAAEVVDVNADGGDLRGWSWLVVWRRGNTTVDVQAGQGGEAAVSWSADAGRGFGGIDAAVPHPTLAAADYAYGDTLAALGGVPVAAFSSRLFEARWSGTAAAVAAADLVRDGRGTLRGSFTLHLPFPLRDCRLAHGGWVYDVGDLASGGRHDLAAGPGPRSLAGELARRAEVREREAASRWDRTGTDLARILEVAGFHAAAGGRAYTGLDAGRLARLDLSPLLPLDRAVLVGTAPEPPPGWTTPWRVADPRGGDAATPPCAARMYRIVLPVAAPPAPDRAAGAAAE